MEDKTLDAIMFAVNEKANNASKLMEQYRNTNMVKCSFWLGQYQAFNEIYTMLNNSK